MFGEAFQEKSSHNTPINGNFVLERPHQITFIYWVTYLYTIQSPLRSAAIMNYPIYILYWIIDDNI